MIVTFVFLLLTNRHEFFEVLSRVIPSYGRIHKALDRFSKNSYILTIKGKQNQKVLTYFETPKFQFTLNQYKFAIGITCKYLNSGTDSYILKENFLSDHTNAFSFDMGILYTVSSRLNIGMTMQNLFNTKLKYFILDDFGHALGFKNPPQKLNTGISYLARENLILSAEIKNLLEDKIKSEYDQYQFKRTYHLGSEYKVHPNFSLRLGYIRDNRPITFFSTDGYEYKIKNIFTLGVGLKYKYIIVDFAMVINDTKSQIEEKPVALGTNSVKGSTFKYLISTIWCFWSQHYKVF